jgi:hypothetical protein
MIHDEVSTVLRSNKIKDITCQMTCTSNEYMHAIAQEETKIIIETHTEDDLNSSGAI